MAVTNIAELNALVERVKKAQREYASFTQEQVDKIFRAAALAAADARIPLAKMAVAESGMGIVEDKVIKNHFASEYIYNAYKDEKTCGVLSEDDTFGTITIAEPIGIICGIVPTTNPTSTAIFKSLISLKTRNAIIFSPHPRAKEATNKAADIVLQAAIAAGAPKDLIGWIDQPSVELSNALMHHPDINLILATGGPGMVKAAYSSGKPAIGVGAGNTPVVIDETADIKRAVASVLMSKTFDNGVICASEQSVVVVDSVYDAVRERFASHGGYLLQGKELKAVQDIILKNGALNAAIVGQPAAKIAELAGFTVPATTKILIGEVTDVDESEPFAHEKLSPTLAMYRAKDFEDAVTKAEKLVAMGGIGHTSCLYTDQDNQPARVAYFGQMMKTARILINTPASQGGIGDLYNFKLAPSLTLGCGSWGGNSISENVGPKHLINKKTVAKRAENMLWHKLPKSIYFRRGSLPIALDEVITDGHKRALIVTDRFLFNNGYADQITSVLKASGVETEVFFEVFGAIHCQGRRQFFVSKRLAFINVSHFTNQNFGGGRNGEACQFGNFVCRLTNDSGVQRAVFQDDVLNRFQLFALQQVAAVAGETFTNGVVDGINNDNGLFRCTDNAVIEGFGHQYRRNGTFNVSGFVNNNRRVTCTYADSRFTGAIGRFNHARTTGRKDQVNVWVVHQGVGELNGRLVDPTDQVFRCAGSNRSLQNDVSRFVGGIFSSRMRREDDRVTRFQADQ